MSKKVKKGDFLEDKTDNIDYEGFNVIDISAFKGEEPYIDLGKDKLVVGQTLGGQNPDTIKRLQIRKTIEEHLDKEKKLNPLGIKVLSLFFIDRVANYRSHDNEGNLVKGKYYKWFEEEYRSLIRTGKYTTLGTNIVDIENSLDKAHNGYFSGDKKKSKSGEEI